MFCKSFHYTYIFPSVSYMIFLPEGPISTLCPGFTIFLYAIYMCLELLYIIEEIYRSNWLGLINYSLNFHLYSIFEVAYVRSSPPLAKYPSRLK